ncbi:MAG: hypothetical protein B6D39_08585 [Anaerolineae bacterium UTCFX2]|jgi:iron complex transport system substrate-binding protein|nr:ABC transporter substrate-binding protein [Anaerolineales bacterium]OQY90124.1 MAG: hypothetical protein B6D39_08585 [Anaerolineae bacterium UTCFX2]
MSSKQIALFVLFTIGINLLAGCSGAVTPAPQTPTQAPIVLVDGLERQIELAGPAQRVVALAPAITEILFAIGAGSQVVGRDTFSNFPTEAESISDVGGGFGELNTEVILSLHPDLVFASELTPPEQIKALEDLGLVVFALPNPTEFEGLFESIRTVASLTGHTEQADQLVAGLQQRLTAVIEAVSQVTERPVVFYEIDGTDPNAPWTPGPGSYIDRLIALAGGENLGNRLGSEWAQISIEELIAQDPDIILLGDAILGGVTVEQVQARPGWNVLSAIKNDKVYTLDDDLVARPGPRMVEGLELLARFIHPELFQ